MTDPYRIRSDDAWAEARADYLTGFTAEEVCRRHDIGLSALRKRARRDGWRRHDQADPAVAADDLEVFEDLEPPDLVEMAWRRLAAAIARGMATDAARWQRIHADLHARAQAEAEALQADARRAAHQQTLEPRLQSPPLPRLLPTGENVHHVHSNSAESADDAPLSRAERRRRLREAQRRS
jgi:hypothetical protein